MWIDRLLATREAWQATPRPKAKAAARRLCGLGGGHVAGASRAQRALVLRLHREQEALHLTVVVECRERAARASVLRVSQLEAHELATIVAGSALTRRLPRVSVWTERTGGGTEAKTPCVFAHCRGQHRGARGSETVVAAAVGHETAHMPVRTGLSLHPPPNRLSVRKRHFTNLGRCWC